MSFIVYVIVAVNSLSSHRLKYNIKINKQTNKKMQLKKLGSLLSLEVGKPTDAKS